MPELATKENKFAAAALALPQVAKRAKSTDPIHYFHLKESDKFWTTPVGTEMLKTCRGDHNDAMKAIFYYGAAELAK